VTAGRRARAALAALALTAAGCGVGEGETTEGEATLTVSRDYGSEELLEATTEDPSASETVLRFIDREADIETRYGGGFVQSIDGLAGGTDDGRRTDWFFYVNGIESPVGAAEVEVRAGDRIWWDHHDWTDVMRAPAVVGSWPAPFSTSEDAAVDCRSEDFEVCDDVSRRIAEAGEAGDEGGEAPTVLVGPWESIRDSQGAPALEQPSARSGVFAGFEIAGSGWELILFDQELDERARLGPGAGLVAASSTDGEGATWIVTGTDEDGVAAAAELLHAETLADRFAIAAPPDAEPIPAPVP